MLPRRWSRRGFSLIELTIVVLVLAISAAVGLPRIATAVERSREDMAARTLVAQLVAARDAARAECRAVGVVFEPNSSRYKVDTKNGLRSTEMDVRFAIDFQGETGLTFDTEGLPDRGGEILFTHQKVSISAQTGEIRLGGPDSESAFVRSGTTTSTETVSASASTPAASASVAADTGTGSESELTASTGSSGSESAASGDGSSSTESDSDSKPWWAWW